MNIYMETNIDKKMFRDDIDDESWDVSGWDAAQGAAAVSTWQTWQPDDRNFSNESSSGQSKQNMTQQYDQIC